MDTKAYFSYLFSHFCRKSYILCLFFYSFNKQENQEKNKNEKKTTYKYKY